MPVDSAATSDDLRQSETVSPSQLKLRSSVSQAPEDIYESRLILNAPDGGWGWMVCLGAFTINFIVGGTIMSFGLILISLLNYFGDSRSKTSWVGSVTDGMSLLSGPLVSFLLQRFTHREVVIFGTILSAFGFIISIWMPNVDFLIFTYGFIAVMTHKPITRHDTKCPIFGTLCDLSERVLPTYKDILKWVLFE
ncbi:Hypothetical predicted protein [Octopus vulgaris]|uniref:Uncharacterized protein n=1 Tax=Octopus vulgaris TaxID=6645 RepID=A0AA36BNN5_OCTVU|nr:Hypothetical predicted protein [Octopus vulgaris]